MDVKSCRSQTSRFFQWTQWLALEFIAWEYRRSPAELHDHSSSETFDFWRLNMRSRLIIRKTDFKKKDRSRYFDGNGNFYQASNGVYLKRTTPRTLKLLPDGSVFSDRAASKIRTRERGWRYAANILVKHGATEPPADNLTAWLRHWTTLLTRPLKHWGNHRYAWSLSDSLTLPPSHRYPKWLNRFYQNGVSRS